jgi:hypothetical protein
MRCSIHQDSGGERTRQSREDGGTISISRPENQHEWGSEGTETSKWVRAAHSKWLMLGRLVQLVIQLDVGTHEFLSPTIVARETRHDDVPFAHRTRSRWPIQAPITRCRRHLGQYRTRDSIRRAQGRTQRAN